MKNRCQFCILIDIRYGLEHSTLKHLSSNKIITECDDLTVINYHGELEHILDGECLKSCLHVFLVFGWIAV